MATGRSVLLALAAALVLLAVAATGAVAAPASFLRPVKLLDLSGGEPSIATDAKGDVYVSGPQGIPAGVNDQAGVGFWVSHDDGATFGHGQNLGSFLGGGDSDVLSAPDGAVYLADLEAVASQVCKSTDHGATFDSVGPTPDPSHCSNVGEGQAGPSDDRQWLTSEPNGTLYLTYHEFVSAQPTIFRSDNGGTDLFSAGPCGSIVSDPAIEANVPQDLTGGTLVAKPTTDAAGNLYVLFATTTQQQNLAALAAGAPSGTFSQLYVAVSHDHCKTFTDYTVFDGSKLGTNTVQFGDIFNVLTTDGAGNLYTIGAGYVGTVTNPKIANIYLSSSHDQGKTWTTPIVVGRTDAAHMLPAAVGGPHAGQLAIGYFRTVNGVTDPNDAAGKWTYATAESSDATAAHPSFSYADVSPGTLYHQGQICNEGILCGLPGQPSDRSLLDFTSATIDGAGCPLFTFAGNEPGTSTSNYATRQVTGCFVGPGGATLVTPPRQGRSKACLAARRLVFLVNPVPGGFVTHAVVYVNGRRVLRVHGRHIRRVAFNRPRGRTLRITIVTTNNKGGGVRTRRTFIGCRSRTRLVSHPFRH